MTNLLVTGAAGFIGSNFVRQLLAEPSDIQVVALDILTYAGNVANLQSVWEDERFKFVKGDICDVELIVDLMADIDIVVNFAAESHVDRSIHSSADFVRTNIVGTQVLADAARKHNIDRFLQVSTDEVYGSLGKTGLFTEQTPIQPNSPYSASKASADLLLQAYYHTYDFPVVITRCSNNYGPYQFPEKLIPLFVTNLVEGKKVPVYGDGMQVRDWLHVDDHCRAIQAVMNNSELGQVYNIGGNNEQANLNITRLILDHLEKDDSHIEHVTDRLGHDRRYAIDASKIKDHLGWQPEVNFEQGLTETMDWYLENKSWWLAIKTGEYLTYYEKQSG